MQKKSLKVAAMAALAGTVFQFGFGGCLGNGFLGFLLREAALEAGLEFVLDNDAVFDLFEDGDPTVATP